MTYILGSRCSDGVVLVADRKFTVDNGASYLYGNKLTNPLTNFAIGFSGSRGVYELFLNDLSDFLQTEVVPVGKGISSEKLLSVISDLITKMNRRFYTSGERFDALVATRKRDEHASLKVFYPDGRMETVDTVKAIGAGAPYGWPFIATIWNTEMTMAEVAEFGYFIVKYIETLGFEQSVGVDEYDPQIWFMPDSSEADYVIETKPELLTKMRKNTSNRIRYLRQGFHDVYYRPFTESDD